MNRHERRRLAAMVAKAKRAERKRLRDTPRFVSMSTIIAAAEQGIIKP